MDNVVVREAVQSLTKNRKQFTSVDVANDIKKKGIWLSNRHVAQAIRNLFELKDIVFDGYSQWAIDVASNTKTATLYGPTGSDPNNYTNVDLVALTPAETDRYKAGVSGTQPSSGSQVPSHTGSSQTTVQGPYIKRPPRNMTTVEDNHSDIGDLLGMQLCIGRHSAEASRPAGEQCLKKGGAILHA
jgi:hypothetical protein